jgi:LPS-assembly lipoprotein
MQKHIAMGVCLCLLLLSGCTGFRPLYGKGPTGENVPGALSSVAVPEQHMRSGQLIRNELLSTMGTGAARFSLRLAVTEKTIDVSTLSQSNLRRKRFNLTAHYELVNGATGKVEAAGDSFSNVSFDTVRQPVADLQAANNAMERAAQEIGQDLRQRIAAYFAVRPL